MSEHEGVLADTLAMTNTIRGAFGMAPLDELPSAQPGQSSDCVFARAFKDVGATSVNGFGGVQFDDVDVAATVAAISGGTQEGRAVQLPVQFAAVIQAFDGANLPELGHRKR